jgi:Xaa-Pro dipeptidase
MESQYFERQQKLLEELPDDVGTAILPPGPTMNYFTGLGLSARERPIALVLSEASRPAIVVPDVELNQVEDVLGTDVEYYTYEDTTDPLVGARSAFDELHDDVPFTDSIAAEYRAFRLLELALIADEYGWEDIVDLGTASNALRSRKAESELEKMRRASEITDEILEATVQTLEPGMTEVDVLSDIKKRILDSDADALGVNTVTAGEHSAHPHASPGDREIEATDTVLIDAGVVHEGYYSDITRTFGVGDVAPEFETIYDVVQEAARTARQAVEPGVSCEAIDQAARDVIEEAGYGDAFTHRVGHGIGLQGHEEPYLAQGNDAPLEVGNVFSVEPGIYVEGLGGVRIEDAVAVTEDGAEVLTSSPRDLRIL